ncbi:MAG: 50S ribosomal protein L10 [Candidatus Saccharibacteria bacterium]|nr:50S ribosomal protein L10 [Candidatus Saccharibacteria bacterium]
MALTKDKKNQVIAEVSQLLADSKMTVIAAYQGTPVKAMQQLRREGRENGTTLKVVKNRLVKKTIETTDNVKDTDTSALNGMLLYAFNSQDEVAPAQVLADYAVKSNLRFNLSAQFQRTVSSCRQKKFRRFQHYQVQTRTPLLKSSTLTSPLDDVTNGLSGNLHALLDGVETKAVA